MENDRLIDISEPLKSLTRPPIGYTITGRRLPLCREIVNAAITVFFERNKEYIQNARQSVQTQ